MHENRLNIDGGNDVPTVLQRTPARRRSRCATTVALPSSAALCGGPAAKAGQPLAIDDAAVVDGRTCQLEGWLQRAHGGHEYWLSPACNPFYGSRFGGDASDWWSIAGFRLQSDALLGTR